MYQTLNERYHLPDCFAVPQDYHPPSSLEEVDTLHPETNSWEYRERRFQPPTTNLYPFFHSIDVDTNGNYLLSTNNYCTRKFNSNVFVFKSFIDIANRNINNKISLVSNGSPVTCSKFLSNNVFVIHLQDTRSAIWELKNDNDNHFQYNIAKNVTCGYVTCMDVIHKSGDSLTGTSTGNIYAWEYNKGIYEESYYIDHAHTDRVNGICYDPNSNGKVFASCSDDRDCLLWDLRGVTPKARSLMSNSEHTLTSVCWNKKSGQYNHIQIGDFSGNMWTIDTRQPNIVLDKIKACERSITKMLMLDEQLIGCVSSSNKVKIYDMMTMKCIYENNDSKNIVTDIIETPSVKRSIYAIGYEYFAKILKY